MANKHAAYDLAQMQSLPLEAKILMAKRRIQEWYDYWDGGVYVSFSGGKDSTVLLHLVRSIYPDVQAVFVNTGLEYPEIQAFAKQHDNVTILRPSMSFNEVLGEYGYPMIGKDVAQRLYYAKRGTASALRDLDAVNPDGTYSKFKASHYGKYKPMVSLPIRFSHKCCLVMKEAPLRTFGRQHHMHPILGTMATESMRRKQAWMAVVVFAQNQRDEVRDLGTKAGCISAEPGMKQQTYVLQGNMIGRSEGNGPQGDGINEDVSFTLNTVDRHAVYTMTTGSFTQVEEDIAPTIMARDYKDPNAVCMGRGYTVRRLTPTECARLQGFPDWWCDDLGIEPTTDDLRYWCDVFETHRRIVGGSSKPKSLKQITKWLRDPHSDAAEYKMWGNGVALPCVWFVLCGIVWANG